MRQLATGFFVLATIFWAAGIITLTISLITTGNLWWLVPIGIVAYLIHFNINTIKELRNL